MANHMPSTVGIHCPRCGVPIPCALVVSSPTPKPGQPTTLDVSVPDLGDRVAEHYRDSGHVTDDEAASSE